MPYRTHTPWLNQFVLTGPARRAGDISDFYRAARAGKYVRLAAGVYLPSGLWRDLSPDDRFLARIHAAAHASREGVAFSHLSAAALWRLPNIGPWPDRPEVIVGANASGPSRRAFTARQYPADPRPDVIDGLAVTSLARTVVDVARTRPLAVAVAMLDRALAEKPHARGLAGASVTPAQIATALAGSATPRGRRRCALAIELADGRSGSPGESLSRTGMHLLGLPMPVLQHEFRDALGRMVVDFWWPEFDLIGEFDGFGKYLREDLRNGRSAGEVVVAEKQREDRLRALGPRVTRWGWDVAESLPALQAHLRDAGLR